jgi:hypothetical protein
MKTAIKEDLQKAASLKKSALLSLERISVTDRIKYPSNALIDYYDIIHKLMEAIALASGVKMRGEGSHQELIDFVSSKLKLEAKARSLLQEMRNYRNLIQYEGYLLSPEFITNKEQDVLEVIRILLRKAN